MGAKKLTIRDFEKFFEDIKDDILSPKFDKTKEKDIIKRISENVKLDEKRLVYFLLKKMARIDRKLDISVEITEMYVFATIYCLAKKMGMDEKETNALYDEIEKEAKGILEGAVKAKEEMKNISQMFSIKHNKKNK